MADRMPKRSRRDKSRRGCLVCKRRKLKCDEQEPSCQRCIKIGVECPGYTRPVKWSTKHEKGLGTSPAQIGSFSDTCWFEQEARKLSSVIEDPLDIVAQSTNETRGSSCATSTNQESTSPASVATSRCSEPLERDHEALEYPSSESCLISTTASQVHAGGLRDTDVTLKPILEDLPLLSYTPTEESSVLLNHYFSIICQVNSSFDSLHNPFRSEVSRMILTSPLLFHCVLSMSAAHLYQNNKNKSRVPLEFQTEAISQLSSELSQIDAPKASRECEVSLGPRENICVKDDVLLGIILLGMTSAWHDASSTGLSHLVGSRQLFKAWVSSNGLDKDENRSSMTRSQSFLVSSMVYWEAMSSFLLNQETDALSYLDIFRSPAPPSIAYPCPWTGVGTPIFVFLAKTGTLLRNKRILRNLHLLPCGESHQNALYSGLLEKASSLEQGILKFRLPFVGSIEDMGDPCTPPDHLLALARSYRLATLLELYRAFPEIAESTAALEQAIGVGCDETDSHTHLILSLAFGLLEILERIPSDSGTVSIQLLALLIAGSALGCVSTSVRQEVTRWRRFVRERVLYVYLTVGLRPINHASAILEEVWSRMDMAQDKSLGSQVHWLDVMSEMKLETILG
ncbi:hypothetical protein ACJZ2D_002810 [Fusarium nematophilum]